MDAPYGIPIGQVEISIPRRLTSPPQHVFLNLPDTHKKDPSAWCLRGLIGCDVRSISVGYENTLPLKDVSDSSDEHQLPIVFWIVGMSLNELRDCTTHQIRIVDLILVTDIGHFVFEDIG